jgi:hypothetical protein
MEILGYIFLVFVALMALIVLVMLVREAPGIRRYLRIRNM